MSLAPTPKDRKALNAVIAHTEETLSSFLTNLEALQKEKALELATVLEKLDPTSPSAASRWATIIDITLNLGVPARKIARQSGCSVSTVTGWKDGVSTLSWAGRHHILTTVLIPLLRERGAA